ncbi:hypothetical protein Nepgr_011584 [Nepenthes gracilis]|uniref:Uncharacterized protein n=1 Tax=Nepenthes gracilis TaxID=150966 RepID=A0AAD3SEL7_NEPGR|nr:hypothetical protein Nepgr_011584 [Nepenthes gracilis]
MGATKNNIALHQTSMHPNHQNGSRISSIHIRVITKSIKKLDYIKEGIPSSGANVCENQLDQTAYTNNREYTTRRMTKFKADRSQQSKRWWAEDHNKWRSNAAPTNPADHHIRSQQSPKKGNHPK